MRYSQRTGDAASSASPPSNMPGEKFTRVFVTWDAGLVILLAFAFGFGNGWATARILGVNPWIAPLIQPAVDLAVVGLMIGIRYLAVHGMTDEELAKPRRWLRFFGAMTLGMNIALPLAEKQFGRAAWDSIGPILLIAWSELAPWMLRAIYSVRAVATPAAPEALPEEEPEEAPQEEEPEEEGPQEEEAPTPSNVLTLPTGDHKDIVRAFLLDWKARGRTFADRPAAALYKVMVAQKEAGVVDDILGHRRYGQLCKEIWFAMSEEAKKGA